MNLIDFENLANNLNIPILRKDKFTAWLNILVSPLIKVQYWWQERIEGSSYTDFSSLTDYNIYDTVKYGRAAYWCIKTPPVGLHPRPTNTDYWYKILDDYIGIQERSSYSAQKVMLEYALNRRFSPLTITPPFGPLIPSIYIVNNLVGSNNVLYSAPSGTNTNTWVAPNSSTRFWYSSYGNPSLSVQYNYTIYVPAAIYSAIDSNPTQANYLLSQEVDKYNLAGMLYNIQSY